LYASDPTAAGEGGWCPPADRAGESFPALRGSETILVVDDDRWVLCVAREVLSEFGYTVLEASEGEEALAVVETWPGSIRLLLTDFLMPRMNGFQLSRRASALRPDMRTLLISGSPVSTIGDHSAPFFLQKPFTRLALLRAVRRVLDAGPG
jgi:CheY-like chemotaxis protein